MSSLEGRVANIVNERELVITIGESDGVKEGQIFRVLAESPTPITHPETGEALGDMDREKVRVKIVEVSEKFSVCRTYRKRYVGGGGMPDITRLMGSPRREVPETLRVDDKSKLPEIDEEESYVKRGDRVVIVEEDS